jgi:hypothetical protein
MIMMSVVYPFFSLWTNFIMSCYLVCIISIVLPICCYVFHKYWSYHYTCWNNLALRLDCNGDAVHPFQETRIKMILVACMVGFIMLFIHYCLHTFNNIWYGGLDLIMLTIGCIGILFLATLVGDLSRTFPTERSSGTIKQSFSVTDETWKLMTTYC